MPVHTNISLESTTFPEGGDVSIPCNVEGYPYPQVHWFKEERIIQPNERVSVSGKIGRTLSDETLTIFFLKTIIVCKFYVPAEMILGRIAARPRISMAPHPALLSSQLKVSVILLICA